MIKKRNPPINWQKVKLGEKCYITKLAGYEFTKFFNSYKDSGEIIVLRGINLKNGGIDLSNIKTIPKLVSNNLVRSKLNRGDLVFSYVGTIGPVAFIEENDKYHLGPNVCKISPSEYIDPFYLYQYFKTNLIGNEINKRISVTAQPSLSMEKIRDFEIIIPESIDDQIKIATILSTVDEEIQKTDQIIQKNEKLKIGVLSNLFSDSDVKIEKLDSIALKITDGTHRTPKYLESGVPFLRINDIQESNINWSKVKRISRDEHLELIRRCNPEKGDVLLSKNGTIGITKVIDWDEEFSIFVSLCLIKPNKDFISPDYLNLVLGSEYVMNQIKKRSKQGTVTNLHLEEIRDFNIPLPSIDRQKEIIEKINLIDLKINNEKHNFDKLIGLKNGLMNDIFNQKVEVKC